MILYYMNQKTYKNVHGGKTGNGKTRNIKKSINSKVGFEIVIYFKQKT